MKRFNIVREHGVVIQGRALPIGAVYGQIDVFYPITKHNKNGEKYTVTAVKPVIFVCENFKSHGWGFQYNRQECEYNKSRHSVYEIMVYDKHGTHRERYTYTVGNMQTSKVMKTDAPSWHHAYSRKQYSDIGAWLDKMLIKTNCENNRVHTKRDCKITGKPTEKKAQVIKDSSFKAGKIGYVLNTHVATDYSCSYSNPYADFGTARR